LAQMLAAARCSMRAVARALGVVQMAAPPAPGRRRRRPGKATSTARFVLAYLLVVTFWLSSTCFQGSWGRPSLRRRDHSPWWSSRSGPPASAAAAAAQVDSVMAEAEASAVAKLEAAEARLRKAEAFRTPDVEVLRAETAELRRLADAERQATAAKEAAAAAAAAAEAAITTAADGDGADAAETTNPASAKGDLGSRLNLETIQAMSDEEKVALAQEVGPAFTVSIAIVGITYWSLCLPIFVYAWHESTGTWPSVGDLSNLGDAGRTAGAIAGLLSLAALLKPVRLAAAMWLTPWTANNVMPRLPSWMGGGDGTEGSS